MSHKYQWRGLLAAAALLLTTPAFSREPITVQFGNKNFGPEDNLIVFDAAVSPPGIFVGVGEFGGSPGCPTPPGGRPPFPHHPPGGPLFGAQFSMPQFMMPPPPFANVDLSDDQVGRLAKLNRAFDAGNAGEFAALRTLENQMRDQLAAENINESDVRKSAEEIAQQKADISKRFSAHILEAAKVLTAEQRKKIKLMQDRMELLPLGGFDKPPHPPMPPRPPEPGK